MIKVEKMFEGDWPYLFITNKVNYPTIFFIAIYTIFFYNDKIITKMKYLYRMMVYTLYIKGIINV